MATSAEYVEYVCDQIHGIGDIRYRKMFGEFMVYVNDRPVLLVCDNTVYVKMLKEISSLMENAEIGKPYEGAKEHFILDIENHSLCQEVIEILKEIIPIPKSRKKKSSN